jgi:hypothetical protein
MSNVLNLKQVFQCGIYSIEKLEFINLLFPIAEEFANKQKQVQQFDQNNPILMTEDFTLDYRVKDFLDYTLLIGDTILKDQGYNLSNLDLTCQNIWAQEYYKNGSMEEHVHANGVQLTAFYFLQTPAESLKMFLHDPRPAKKQIDLPELDVNNESMASSMINIEPKAGCLYFINAWLPHSFSRNRSDTPVKFLHLNIGTQLKQPQKVNSPIIV